MFNFLEKLKFKKGKKLEENENTPKEVTFGIGFFSENPTYRMEDGEKKSESPFLIEAKVTKVHKKEVNEVDGSGEIKEGEIIDFQYPLVSDERYRIEELTNLSFRNQEYENVYKTLVEKYSKEILEQYKEKIEGDIKAIKNQISGLKKAPIVSNESIKDKKGLLEEMENDLKELHYLKIITSFALKEKETSSSK